MTAQPIADERSATPAGRTLALALVAFILLIIVRNAWLSDDAFITFRSVDNFVNGRGMTWNPGQRVQVFTHPLWFFVVSTAYALTHEMYYTAIALCIAVSLSGLLLAARLLAVSEWAALPPLIALGFSRAFIDFSTSGLENPLSHALLVAWLICLVRAQPGLGSRWFDVLTGLLLWNRLDLALLVGPAWSLRMWQRHRAGFPLRRLLIHALYASAPLLVWFAFAFVYFGFALPNTAYAKLGIRIAPSHRFAQGFFYGLNLIGTDPASALLILIGAIMTWRLRTKWASALLVGMGLYVLYVGYIGGDFMAGRFFSALMIVASASLFRTPLDRTTSLVLAAVLGLAGWAGPTPPLFSGAFAEGRTGAKLELKRYRIMDERRFYYANTGLLNADRLQAMPSGRYRGGLDLANHRGKVVGQIGMRAFLAGPSAALIDPFALTDPFLARLPSLAKESDEDWTTGHWKRPIPDGYRESVETASNRLTDAKLARLYDAMQLITTGPIWSLARFRAIWRLNTGRLDWLARGATGEDTPEDAGSGTP